MRKHSMLTICAGLFSVFIFLLLFSCFGTFNSAMAASAVVKVADVEIKGKVFEEITPVNVTIDVEGVTFSEYTSTAGFDWIDYLNLPKGLSATKIYWSRNSIVLRISGTPIEGSSENLVVSLPYIAIKELIGQYNPSKSLEICMTSEINEYAVVDIEKIKVESIEVPSAKSITYGDKMGSVRFTDYTKEGVTLSIVNANEVPNAGKNYVIVKLLYDNVNSHDYSSIAGFLEEDDSLLVSIPVTVKPRKLVYASGSAEKKYDGTSLVCKDVILESGKLVEGDAINVVPYGMILGIGEVPNHCYILPEDNTILENYDIQIKPGILKMTIGTRNYRPDPVKSDETIFGKQDGEIRNLTSEMEYSLDNINFFAVDGDKLSDLEAGTYYLRYKNNGFYEASDSTKVDILPGRKLKIAFFTDNEVIAVRETQYEGIVNDIPEIPEKEGFDRKSPVWDRDLTEKITEDTPVYAIYYQNIYFITYELNGGEIKEDTTTFFRTGDVITYPTALRKKGEKFAGFYDNPMFEGDVLSGLPSGAKNDIILYAKWIECEHDEDFEEATCLKRAHCNICDEDFGLIKEHEWDSVPTMVSEGHAILCKFGCGTIKEGSFEEHFIEQLSEFDEDKHKGICICGYYEILEHEMFIENIEEKDSHVKKCACGFEILEAHSFSEWSATIDEAFVGHERKCICGFIEKESHVVDEWKEIISPTISSEGTSEGVCLVCDTMVYEIVPKLEVTPIPTKAVEPTPTPIVIVDDIQENKDIWSQINEIFDFDEFFNKLKNKDQYAIIIAAAVSGGLLAVLLNVIIICVVVKGRKRRKNDNTKNSLN
ncbi:MAG: InlB B-repeat-containing protein [Lachnospiraceae bacterium]|nr:InlB B-repeat-containing protein [Lachnospiraceae bacterium]